MTTSRAASRWRNGSRTRAKAGCRFQDHITRLEVFLTDVDAAKSGVNDKRCRLEARVTGRQPVTVTAEGDKMANAFIGAVEKLMRALDADLGRVKDRNGRDTIRTAVEGQDVE